MWLMMLLEIPALGVVGTLEGARPRPATDSYQAIDISSTHLALL
jgi:hypothetical protein